MRALVEALDPKTIVFRIESDLHVLHDFHADIAVRQTFHEKKRWIPQGQRPNIDLAIDGAAYFSVLRS